MLLIFKYKTVLNVFIFAFVFFFEGLTMKKLALCLYLFIAIEVFALDGWNSAVAEILPGSGDLANPSWVEKITSHGKNAGEDLIVTYDKNDYAPYGYCHDIVDATGKNFKEGTFRVFSISESLEMANQNLFIDRWHWMLIYTMNYTVTCGNKITYRGVFKWRTQLWSCKIGCNENPDTKQYDLDVSKYNYSTNTFEAHRGRANEEGKNVVPISSLIAAWNGRKIVYPEWTYLGEPGKKLPRPVIFVHGLNSSYDTWGVVPVTDVSGDAKKAEESFQKGLVKKYLNGSAPDIIARMQNIDNTEANINKNGIYFYQAPGFLNNKDWWEAGLEWDGRNVLNSQSRKLYQRIIDVLDDFYGRGELGWIHHPELVVDLVTHSQGGLVVREMLRGLRAEGGDLEGPQNAANHIGKIITVDTPHFGSELAVQKTSDLENEFPGLKLIIDDLDAQEKGNPQTHNLITASLDLNWYSFAWEVGSGAVDFVGYDSPLAIFQPLAGALGWLYGAATDWATDVTLYVKGPYVGEYVPVIEVDGVGIDKTIKLGSIKTMDKVSQEVRKIRRAGAHLDKNSSFMQNIIDKYLKRPDGSNVELRPLYSPSTKRFLADLFYSLGEEANKICEENDESKECFAAGAYFRQYAMGMAEKQGVAEISDVDFDDNLWKALMDVQDNWLSKSDVAVTEYSQKFQDSRYGISSELVKELKTPRSYMYHDALAPWEDVLHMPVKDMNDGATRQGLDIACALDFYCDKTLQKYDSKIIYLNQGSVALTGDFDISPMFMEGGIQEVTVSDGTNYIKATYTPTIGSVVTYSDGNGNEVQDVIVDAVVSTTPTISRIGKDISVSFNNYSGKMYTKTYSMSNLSENVTYSIGNGNNGILPKVVAGVANVTDPTTQTPPSTPKDKFYSKSSIFAMHREARDEHERNTSRPRILVANGSDADVNGFKVAYYFTADPARKPVVDVDYPDIPVKLENLGGDQWRFVLDGKGLVIKAHSVFPSKDGWQIRVHYSDWFDYKHLNDWSADYNTGIPAVNRKIVVYSDAGEILWGAEPKMFKSSDDGIVASPKGTISWVDAAPWESNMFKPQVTVSNTGKMNLEKYHAKMWFRVPAGKTLQPPPEDWYTPESRPSLKNIGENVWELDMYFDKHILYFKDSVTEGNVGLHLADWSDFDKTVCGIALVDSEGNVIYGQIPSVETCQSYDQPSLIVDQFAWSI